MISPAQETTDAPEQGFLLMYSSTASRSIVSQGVARCRDASRVPEMCPECVLVFLSKTTRDAHLQALCLSPLTDSNRRPPPYHGTTQATGRNRRQRFSLE